VADLSVRFAGVRFKNPVVAAAATPTLRLSHMKKCIEAGVGAIETKSISFNPKTWPLQRPANVFLDKYGEPGTLVTYETAFPSPDLALNQIKEIKPLAEKEDVRLIANIDSGSLTYDKWGDYGRKLEEAGVDMILVCVPCPIYAPSMGKEHYEWYREHIPRVIKAFKDATSVPFLIKTYEPFTLVREHIKIIDDGGADGIHLIGFMPGTILDIETGKPLNPGGPMAYGWGHALRGISCYSTAIAASITQLPIMSSGGISTWRDAAERLMCGATLTAVATAVIYRGYKVFTDMVDGLERFMERKGYEETRDLVGIATPYIEKSEDFEGLLRQIEVPKDHVAVTVDPVKCTGCGVCAACLFGAVTVEAGLAKIDPEFCERCGVCSTICPLDAITLKRLK